MPASACQKATSAPESNACVSASRRRTRDDATTAVTGVGGERDLDGLLAARPVAHEPGEAAVVLDRPGVALAGGPLPLGAFDELTAVVAGVALPQRGPAHRLGVGGLLDDGGDVVF